MTDSIEVREATPADAAEVVRLLSQLGHAIPPGFDEARLAAFLEGGEHALVAARAGSAAGAPLLGAATLHVTPMLHRPGPVGRITSLIVDDGARGRGIGRALVGSAEVLLAARGCVFVEVTSNKKRTEAHAFYERLGYTATSFRFGKSLRSGA
jgi:ribosomal protein S18 acetylase RimI-like enzyme